MSNFVMVRHMVSYFPHWITIFEKNQRITNEHGLKALHVLKDEKNCNNMTILLVADDLEKAKEFMTSPFIKDAMKKAGVLTEPEITYLSDATDGL